MSQVIPAAAVEAAISDEAFRAANARYMEVLTDLRLAEGGGLKVASQNRRALRAALEAAAPHMRSLPSAAEQAMDRILITLTAVTAGQVPQDVALTVIREISEHYTKREPK